MHRVFHFDSFEVDEATGELRKHGTRVKLHAQPFQVLVMLLEKPLDLVSREEIRQRLWPEGTFVDFDHGLNTAVNKLRQALRDSASAPKYVETVPGKGYRFIALVTCPPKAIEAERVPAPQVKTLLADPREMPAASRKLVLTLLLLCQAMYLAFYMGALANLPEIREILEESRLPWPPVLFAVLVTTAAGFIPVRLFLSAAVLFDAAALPKKFAKLFPALLFFDVLWALAPFLLIHHVNIGVALGMCAALVYLPFAQRSLVFMYARDGAY